MWRRFKRDRVAIASIGFLVLLIIAVYPGAWIAEKLLGHGPNDIFPSALDDGLLPVGPMSRVENFETGGTDLFILGADGTLGRDEFLRLLYGGRVSLQVAVISTLLVMLIGVTTGAIAGYYRGLARHDRLPADRDHDGVPGAALRGRARLDRWDAAERDHARVGSSARAS